MRAKLALVIAAALGVASCSGAAAVENGVATDEGIAAIALPEEQLRFMLGQSVMGSQSGPMAMYALGLDRGCEVFEEARDKAVEQNLPQWRTNLVAAYRNSVPADQLASAVESSPQAAQRQLASFMPAIGSAMQRASASLLSAARTQVITAMSKEADKVDPNSIDQADRQRGLERMKSEGKICGVGPARGNPA